MKEFKALEILKNIRKVIEVSQYNNSGVTFGKATLFECDEAIAEIEVFQANCEAQEIIITDLKKQSEPKACDGCEYEFRHRDLKPCINCVRSHDQTDYYEPKDNILEENDLLKG